jgi:integrase
MKTNLNAKTVASLQLPDGKTDVIFWDDDVSGFGYRLRRGAGGKIIGNWVLQYRHNRVSRRLVLGDANMTAKDARAKAKVHIGLIAEGKDPHPKQGSKKEDPSVKTFKDMADKYLAIKKLEVRERTAVEQRRYLTGEYFEELHNKPLDKITRADVADCLTEITRKSPIVAGCARSKLSAFFTWAMGAGQCQANPVIGTNKPKGGKQEKRVLSGDEIVAIWKACGDDDYGRCIKLLILTGCRRLEIGGMRWKEIADEMFTLPAERSKNHRAHSLPMLPMMRAVLPPRVVGPDHLFGTKSGFVAWSASKAALDARLPDLPDWTVHDIRRSVATHMATDLSIAPHIIEAILNHQSGHKAGVAGIYIRSTYPRDVKLALIAWHEHLQALIAGERIEVERSIA